jgi:7-keto-8-aminopelargonate synthetase-like enzyme
MGTLSKTLSSCGGYICGATPLIEFLKCMSGGFIYSVGLSPPLAAASKKALEILHREPERIARLRKNSRRFFTSAQRFGLDTGLSEGHAVIPVVVHSSISAVALSQRLFECGINVQPIIHPAVPERSARLRFFVTSEHSEDQIDKTCAAIAEEAERIGDGTSLLMPGQILPSGF